MHKDFSQRFEIVVFPFWENRQQELTQPVGAENVVSRLRPYCKRLEVAGSIRRQKPTVKDIDLVLIPADHWNLQHELSGLGPITHRGEKMQRLIHNGTQVDIYFATEQTWATLLLIRTGSAENNIRLCALAKRKGWHLSADGEGLFNQDGQRVAGDTEASIYEALGIPYQEPAYCPSTAPCENQQR